MVSKKEDERVDTEEFIEFWEDFSKTMGAYFNTLFAKDPDTRGVTRDMWVGTLIPLQSKWQEYQRKVRDTFKEAPSSYQEFKNSVRVSLKANPRLHPDYTDTHFADIPNSSLAVYTRKWRNGDLLYFLVSVPEDVKISDSYVSVDELLRNTLLSKHSENFPLQKRSNPHMPTIQWSDGAGSFIVENAGDEGFLQGESFDYKKLLFYSDLTGEMMASFIGDKETATQLHQFCTNARIPCTEVSMLPPKRKLWYRGSKNFFRVDMYIIKPSDTKFIERIAMGRIQTQKGE